MDLLRVAITEMGAPFAAMVIVIVFSLLVWSIVRRVIREKERDEARRHELVLLERRQIAAKKVE